MVVGLRHWYAHHRLPSSRALLDKVSDSGVITTDEAELIWQEYVSLQLLGGCCSRWGGSMPPRSVPCCCAMSAVV